MIESIIYQINTAILSCEARITNGADIEQCFIWLNEELAQIYEGAILYEIN